MPTPKPGPTKLQSGVRFALVGGYAGLVAFGLISELQPRVFWTMLLPLLPISIVLMGFANWRRVCPLAAFGEIGKRLNRGTQRRVPKWFERWFLVILFSGMLVMLVFRLVATNGDGVWLSWLLVGLALAAMATNLVFTGKTWCNFFCPVSLIERIYTEPRSLAVTPNSQCIRCTACKSGCPDIDPENAYWRDLLSAGRRFATYAFPGLVLAFYTYFWLRHGDWDAYFDGRWTRIPADFELAFGQGFFFAPQVPAIAAATLSLALFSLVSFAFFSTVEHVVKRFVDDAERRRHLVLALASFAAFSIFYVFAGAPSLRKIEGGTRVMAFTAPLLATLFLAHRWGRTREGFIREKSAAKLLRNWPYDEPPPDDPREVYGWIKAGEHAREHNVAAYASTVREMIADGLVRAGELRLLEGVRKQLGISEREHEKVVARLSEEERDLFSRERAAGAEERAQLESYQTALAAALVRHATDDEIAELRRAFGIDREAHDKLLESMRGESGVLLDRARAQIEHIRTVRADLESLSVPDPSEAEAFLSYLLRREQCDAIQRALDLLEIVGPGERVRALRFRLFGEDAATVVRQLADACPAGRDLVLAMEPWIVEPLPAPTARDSSALARTVEGRSLSPDPYVRAAAAWIAAAADEDWSRPILERAAADADELVRDAARGADDVAAARSFTELGMLAKMQFLRGVNLFAKLAPEDLRDLLDFVTEETVPLGTAICEQGDVDSDDLFVLIEGRASVVIAVDGATREREVAVIEAGEIVGEMSMLDGSARSATVRPKDAPVRMLRVSGERFRNRLLPRARVARPLLVTLAQRIRNMSR